MLIAILCPWIWQIVWLVPVNHSDFIRKSNFFSPMKPERKDNWKINLLKSVTQRCLSFSIFETYAFDCVRKTNVWLLALGLYAFHRHTIKLFFSGGGIRQGNRLETRFGNFISRFKLSNVLKTIWWKLKNLLARHLFGRFYRCLILPMFFSVLARYDSLIKGTFHSTKETFIEQLYLRFPNKR